VSEPLSYPSIQIHSVSAPRLPLTLELRKSSSWFPTEHAMYGQQ